MISLTNSDYNDFHFEKLIDSKGLGICRFCGKEQLFTSYTSLDKQSHCSCQDPKVFPDLAGYTKDIKAINPNK